jgi:hypothetical protein
MLQFYHITTPERAKNLCREGADRNYIGRGGGTQDGICFYVSRSLEEIDYWHSRLFTFNAQTEVLVVSVPDTIKIASNEQFEGANRAMKTWAPERGLATYQGKTARGKDLFLPTDKLLQIHGITREEYDGSSGIILSLGIGHTATGLFLQEQGFDAYEAGDYTIVIMNYDLLRAQAFSAL